MAAISFLPVVDATEIQLLAKLADEVWHEYFPCILSADQIDYMVGKFQSKEALTDQITKQGYSYFVFTENGENIGYTGIKFDNGKLFLSKLYMMKKFRGKGYSSQAMDFLKGLAEAMDMSAIWLTVNKYNEHSIKVYEHFGFQKVRDEVTEIGKGYVMDDYVMELTL